MEATRAVVLLQVTASQARDLEIVEKVTSVLSVLGAAFIITTFLSNSKFRKPINRLVFYAAWGNLFANVATLISRSGINLGVTSPLCQFQAFLIHWFLPADALWTFAMACNVWLSFFRHYDASQLRALEWKYLVGCYGIPFVPAIVYLFIKSSGRGKVYGNAVLWCWVSTKWDVLRIATFYGPIWLVILVTMFIYVKVGMVVFRWRKQLLSLNNGAAKHESQTVRSSEYAMTDLPTSPTTSKRYEVTISSQVPHSPRPNTRQLSSPRHSYHEPSALSAGPPHTEYSSIQETAFAEPRVTNVVIERPPIKTLDANKAALSYCKTAMLFFIALLCTWVPSTVNRLYSLIHSGNFVYGLAFTSALVLPLQGFWNTVIYVVTSLPACKAVWAEARTSLFRSRSRAVRPDRTGMPTSMGIGLSRHTTRRTIGSDDDRADFVMSLEGERRVLHHKYSHQFDDAPDEETRSANPVFVHGRREA